MRFQRFLYRGLTVLLACLLGLSLLPMGRVQAETVYRQEFIELDPVKNQGNRPIFGYGADLTENELIETAKIFGISDWQQVHVIPITVADMQKFVRRDVVAGTKMFSSVMIQNTVKKQGVQVHVLTPDKISQITAAQYAAAAITAGVRDAKVVVGTVKQATGESALSGIYKAYQESGETLDSARMALAQDELEIVSQIAADHRDESAFDETSYEMALIRIKEILSDRTAELRQELPSEQQNLPAGAPELSLSLGDVTVIVQNALQEFDLAAILTPEQQTELAQYFSKWQQSPAADDQAVGEQLKQLADRVIKYGTELLHEMEQNGTLEKIKDLSITGLKKAGELAKEGYREAEKNGWVDQALDFVKKLAKTVFDGLSSIFSSSK